MQRAGRRTLLIGGILVAAVMIFFFWTRRADTFDPVDGSAAQGAGEGAGGSAAQPSGRGDDTAAQARGHVLAREAHVPARPGMPGAAAGDAPREVREARLQRARTTLERYLESTKYPPESRPLSEQPDQVEPHHVPPTRLPLAGNENKDSDVRVILRQDRFYLSGDETVTFTVECGTIDGPAPCDIQSSIAAAPGTDRQVEVPFTPAGGEEMYTAALAPQTQGFAGYHGPIHLALALRIAGESGTAGFDVEYTPEPPATFTGRVTDRLKDGSLVIGLEMDIDEPGRYVLAARVDDANGKSFAYLGFNDELPRGRVEAPLVLFGKLVLDEEARAPFRLRDVEGFLLREDAYPDRALIPTVEGVMHTTRSYERDDFSPEEWQSEQRDRYVEELTRDVERAEDAL